MKQISIVVPAYNEARNIEPLYTAVSSVFETLSYELELLYVNDGSTDETQDVLDALSSRDARVKYVVLARNSGQQAATAAGLAHASGDAVMIMDADLQHPPTLVPSFIKAWEAGSEAIFGVRGARTGESALRRFLSRTFWRLMNMLMGIGLPPDAADFCLLDRRVVTEFRRLPHRDLMTRARIAMIPARRTYLPFDVGERFEGTSNYSFKRLLQLFVRNIVARYMPPRSRPFYEVVRTNCV